MPTITCKSCGAEIEIEEEDYEGTIECPECYALIYVIVKNGKVRKVELEEEEEREGGFEEEEW